MANKNNNEFVENFINEWFSENSLWNVKSYDNRNRDEKVKAIQRIANKLEISGYI